MKKLAAGGLACTLALAVGCSSGSGGSTTSAAAGSTASSSATSTSAGSGVVGAATAALAAPSNLAQVKLANVPLKAKPTPGKLILSLTSVGAERQWEGVQAAAKAAGWQAKSIQIDLANPSSLLSGMNAALALKPFAVTFAGAPESEWASELPSYERAGVYIIPVDVGQISKPSPMIKATVSTNADETKNVELAANWFIADSKGVGKVLVPNFPDFPTHVLNLKVFSSYVASHCPRCSVKSVDLPVSAAYTNQTTSTVVSQLQTDPSIKYVDTYWGVPLAGFTAALQAANLQGVHLFGYSASLQQLQQMKNGSLPGAWVANQQKIFGWMAVDIALRLAEGMPVRDGDGGTPVALLTAGNIGNPTAESQEIPSDYATEFKTLWHVSG